MGTAEKIAAMKSAKAANRMHPGQEHFSATDGAGKRHRDHFDFSCICIRFLQTLSVIEIFSDKKFATVAITGGVVICNCCHGNDPILFWGLFFRSCYKVHHDKV